MSVEGTGGTLQKEGSFLPGSVVVLFLFLLLFLFFLHLPTAGHPVVHTFRWWAQDWPRSSNHLTAALLMQKPLATGSQHLDSWFPPTIIHQPVSWERIFCLMTVDQLWPRAIHKISLPSSGGNHTFSNEIWIQTLGRNPLFLCLFLPYILSHPQSLLQSSLYAFVVTPLLQIITHHIKLSLFKWAMFLSPNWTVTNTATHSNSKNIFDKPYNLYNILVKWVYSL